MAASSRRRSNPWATINRCVVCGTKLVFLASTYPDAKPDEGSKSCSQNHATFQVFGLYNERDEWIFDFVLPPRKSSNDLSPRNSQ